MSDDGALDAWWGDEEPVRAGRRHSGLSEHAGGPEPGADRDNRDDRADWPAPRPNGGARAGRDHTATPEPASAPPPEPQQSQAQIYVPPPEDLPPFEEVVEQMARGRRVVRPEDAAVGGGEGSGHLEPHRPPDPARRPDGGPAPAQAGAPSLPGGGARAELVGPGARGRIPDADGREAWGPPAAVEPEAPELSGAADLEAREFPGTVDPRAPIVVPAPPGHTEPVDPGPPFPPDDGIPDPPVLGRPPGRATRSPVARFTERSGDQAPRAKVDRRRLATVYDVDGPRVRLGVAWFVGVMVAVALPAPWNPVVTTLVFAVAAGFAGRQIVRAWGAVPWHVDVAAGIAALPVVAAIGGLPAAVGAAVLAVVVAFGCGFAPDGARLPGGTGRVAAVGILVVAVVPAVAGAGVVLVRRESVVAALVLVLVASAYEVGDYIVGSGSSTPIEGPLAGMTTAALVALPLSLMLVEPYDTAGVALLGFAAVACPIGQVLASAVLPGAAAHAPALRRIDTLLLLAPLWVAAAG
jgi:hypothetical protein